MDSDQLANVLVAAPCLLEQFGLDAHTRRRLAPPLDGGVSLGRLFDQRRNHRFLCLGLHLAEVRKREPRAVWRREGQQGVALLAHRLGGAAKRRAERPSLALNPGTRASSCFFVSFGVFFSAALGAIAARCAVSYRKDTVHRTIKRTRALLAVAPTGGAGGRADA